jgi:molecular chaperone HscB
MQNYFELFSLAPDFDINITKLNTQYQQQVAKFHPDKFASSSDNKQKTLALQNTSLINTAFETLKSPLSRANYLLELNGINVFDEKDTQMNVDFLISQIELRESLGIIQTAKDEAALDTFIKDISNKIKDNVKKIHQAFIDKDDIKNKNMVRELKFYQQLEQQANALMDELL